MAQVRLAYAVYEDYLKSGKRFTSEHQKRDIFAIVNSHHKIVYIAMTPIITDETEKAANASYFAAKLKATQTFKTHRSNAYSIISVKNADIHLFLENLNSKALDYDWQRAYIQELSLDDKILNTPRRP